MKLKVDILHGLQTKEGKPVILCTFLYDGANVTCTNETFLKLARTMGVIGADGRTYFPFDGADFLRALQNLYRGPHLTATEPQEVE